jgi:hypothetical protein
MPRKSSNKLSSKQDTIFSFCGVPPELLLEEITWGDLTATARVDVFQVSGPYWDTNINAVCQLQCDHLSSYIFYQQAYALHSLYLPSNLLEEVFILIFC